MNRKELRDYCLDKKATVEEFPFGPEVAVLKVMGKMFALIPVEGKTEISLKCDPEWAVVLRDTYEAVTAGYHLSKRHWNTVLVDGSIPDDEVLEMIDHSYDLVVKGLKKSEREQLTTMK
ncbi:MAG: MmcQ/YjbR family DNA-binding protein [Burkholderiales bacterium]|nr:MmcQ/YjbR family DNA-binding protein [Anaerolineae bacterium]